MSQATIDTMRPVQWRQMTQQQREAFWRREWKRGCAAHSCLTCGYPTVYGQASCKACPHGKPQ